MRALADVTVSFNLSHAFWEWEFFASGRHKKWPYPLHSYPVRLVTTRPEFVRVFWIDPIESEFSMKRRASFAEIEFVTLVLSKSDEKAFVAWHQGQKTDLIAQLSALTSDGYKLSFSHDFDHDCFIVACTGTKNAADNVGRCFTSRASSVEEASWIALYKHRVVCDSSSWGEPSSGMMSWG